MSHPIIYGEKTLFITAPTIQFNTDPSSNTNLPPLTINLGGASTQNLSTFQSATITSVAPTVDTGTVATFATRGAAATLKNGWIKIRDNWPGSGQIPSVQLTIPAIQALTTTGAPTTLYPFGVTAVIPLAYRPTFTQSRPADLVNNAGFVIGRVTIATTGVVSLTLIASGAFTAPFGLVNDTVVDWQITPVGL